MAALEHLRGAGLTVETVAGKLRASPVERITPELRQYITAHRTELLAELAANDPQPIAWLHLLVLSDGRVIQQCGHLGTATVEQKARQQYGGDLLVVVAVPDFERPLSESEIVKALAGTLTVPASPPVSSSAWLIRVARLLGAQPAELLERGYLDAFDLTEQACSDVGLAARLIRSTPAWINRRPV